jgi:hypothetical protein
MDSDPQFHRIYQTDATRVFTLELGRLETTSSYCHLHPFFYVVTSDSATTDTTQGQAGLSHNWHPGEARFVNGPKQHTVRNDGVNPHREIIVEILSKVDFNPLTQQYAADDFPNDLGSAKPTWTISVEHGPMSAVKTQVAPGDTLETTGRTRLVIALTDINVRVLGKDLQLAAQDYKVLAPESDFSITNTARFPARFITIAF